MDSIRKKMQSLKTEISEFSNRSFQSEERTKGFLAAADQYDLDIRDLGRRINSLEQEGICCNIWDDNILYENVCIMG